MLLALDVGNTNVAMGFYRGRGKDAKLVADWRLSTIRTRTADEYGAVVLGFLISSGLKLEDVKHVAISSVVPQTNRDLTEFSRRYFHTEPFFATADADLGMKIRYNTPPAVGADRICNAVGAFHKYGGPLIIIDYGTATTFCAIAKNGDYLGGAIAPGINISMNALFQSAARLYPVEFKTPPAAIGKNTIHSMQSGAVFGFAGQTDALVRRIQKELGGKKAKVIAAGGLATLIKHESETIDVVDQMITLEGLRILFERHTEKAAKKKQKKK
ncbi:MAG: type III pantothenate kinase [Bdellovibrionales bacterium]